MKVSVVVPTYRQSRTIRNVLRQVLAVDLSPLGVTREIIVCDDGSDDETSSLVSAVSATSPVIKLVRHTRNLGKGRAIRTALAHATGDYVLIQDADLEYDPRDYPALLAPVLTAGAPTVYGSRFLARPYPQGMHPANFAANRLLTWIANRVHGLALTDQATCYKLVRTDLLRSLALACEGFEFCAEVTAKLGTAGVPIVEVPVRYTARSRADGKKVGWRDGVRAAAVLLAPPTRHAVVGTTAQRETEATDHQVVQRALGLAVLEPDHRVVEA